jgi:hypothetical protein
MISKYELGISAGAGGANNNRPLVINMANLEAPSKAVTEGLPENLPGYI